MRHLALLLATSALSAALIGCSAHSTAGTSSSAPTTTHAPETSATPSESASTTSARFTSPDGYSLVPPAGWREYPDGEVGVLSGVLIAPSLDPAAKFVDNINVVITKNRSDLGTTIAETKRALPTALTHYRVVIDEPATADGQDAHFLGGTYDRTESGHLENLQLFLITSGKQYTVTFTSTAASFPALRARAQASLLSFKVT
ncbi:hypothetical protein [Kribbella sp. NPDC055071]